MKKIKRMRSANDFVTRFSYRFKLRMITPQLIIGSTEESLDRPTFDASDHGVFFSLRSVSNRAGVSGDQQQFALFANAPLHVRVDTRDLVTSNLQKSGAVRARQVDVFWVRDNDGVCGLVKKVNPFEHVLSRYFGFAHWL